MHRPQIKIFLADGTPTGLRTAELRLSTCEAGQDYGFDSESGAAGVVSGTTVNGKTAWHLPDDKIFKQWEQDRLEADDAG